MAKMESANACVVQPRPRPVRQESANTTTEMITAGTYVKITERGDGQHQRFASEAAFTFGDRSIETQEFKI